MDFAKNFIQGLFSTFKFIFTDVIGGLLNETAKSPLFTDNIDILKGLAISGSSFGIIVLILYKADKIWSIVKKIKRIKRK